MARITQADLDEFKAAEQAAGEVYDAAEAALVAATVAETAAATALGEAKVNTLNKLSEKAAANDAYDDVVKGFIAKLQNAVDSTTGS